MLFLLKFLSLQADTYDEEVERKMTISSHQIHNVLRTYGKQLRRGLRINRMKQIEAGHSGDKVQISSEAKRMQVVERVASEILLGFANPEDKLGEPQKEVLNTLNEEYGEPLSLAFHQESGKFAFAVLDRKTGEPVKSLIGEESEKMNSRLVEITENMVDQTMIKG